MASLIRILSVSKSEFSDSYPLSVAGFWSSLRRRRWARRQKKALTVSDVEWFESMRNTINEI